MAVYDFYRLDVTVVEDNLYVRSILEGLLRHFKIQNITSFANGAEAIEYFKARRDDPMANGSIPDFVIADLVMVPINGLLFLRWLRTAKESPNRFVPFIMLSGAADEQYVSAARDHGADEFLAKPFSAATVYRRILEIVDFPRQIVATQSYFGPDRRRRPLPYPRRNRRLKREEDVVIVYSSDKIVKPGKPTDVWYFRLPNRLKEKVAGLDPSVLGELPLDLLQEAEAELERTALEFAHWALEYLAKLSTLCTEALVRPTRRGAQFEEINLLALELRGQGGTFGYPLITEFAKMLYDATGPGRREDDAAIEIVKAHVDAMRAVLREGISGDGGAIGRDLLASLQMAIERSTMIK